MLTVLTALFILQSKATIITQYGYIYTLLASTHCTLLASCINLMRKETQKLLKNALPDKNLRVIVSKN